MNSMGGYQGYGSQAGPRGAGQGDIIPKGYRKGQIQQFDPQQTNLYNQMYGHVSPDSYLSRLAGGDQSLFDEIEAPALRQFSGLMGGLSSRFSAGGGGPGALSSRKSSGFQNESSAAASNFAQQLQSNRQELQRQAIGDLSGLSNQLLGYRPQEKFINPKSKKRTFLEEFLMSIGPGMAQEGIKSAFGTGGSGGGNSAMFAGG